MKTNKNIFNKAVLTATLVAILTELEIHDLQAAEGKVPAYQSQRPSDVPVTQPTYLFTPIKDPNMSKGFYSEYTIKIFSDPEKAPKPVTEIDTNGLCPGSANDCTFAYPTKDINQLTLNYGGVHDLSGTPTDSGYLPSACFFQEDDWEQRGRPGSSVWGGKGCGEFRVYRDRRERAVNSFALQMDSITPYDQHENGTWLIEDSDHPVVKLMQDYMTGSMPNTVTVVPPLSKITSYRVSFKAKLEYVKIAECREATEKDCNLNEAIHAGIYVPIQFFNYDVSDPNHGKVVSLGARIFDSRDHHSSGTDGHYEANLTGEGYIKRLGMRLAKLTPVMKNAVIQVPNTNSATDHFSELVAPFPSLSYPAESVNRDWVTFDYDFLPALKEAVQIESKVSHRIAPFNEMKADGSYLYTEYFDGTSSEIYDWIDQENYSHFFPSWISLYIEASRKGIITLLVKDYKVVIGVDEDK